MSDSVYEWYCATKKLIKNAEESNLPTDIVLGWKESLEAIEHACEGLKEQYERRRSIQASFTPEQIDHICYQIGEWYLEWKGKMWVDSQPNQHRLGLAKEQLKLMICGE